jgi:hypothetical protein
MALRHAPNVWTTASATRRRATSNKASTRSSFSSQHPGTWSAKIAYPINSAAESACLDDFDVTSLDATTIHGPPAPCLPAYTSVSTCPNQHLDAVYSNWDRATHLDIHNTNWLPCTSRCSTILSTDQELCPVADATTSTSGKKQKLQRNVRSAGANTALGSTKQGQDTFCCRHCPKTFATRSTLQSVSRRNIHCQRKCFADVQPRHHEISHDPIKAHKYHCTTCQKGFRYPKDLKRHSSTHRQAHESGKHSCPICQKRFWRRDNLTRHQRLTSHVQPSTSPGVVDNSEAFEQTSLTKTEDAEPAQCLANEHDQDTSTYQSHSGSNNATINSATGSHVTIPSSSRRNTSATKRTRRPSDGEEGSGDNGRRPKRSRQTHGPVLRALACPFVPCRTICPGGISVLL